MSGFKYSIVILVLLLLMSCAEVTVERDSEDVYSIVRNTIIFISHSGDTIIKCQTNDTPRFGVERFVGKDSKTYYVYLDSLEYLELLVFQDAYAETRWQIRTKK